MELRRGCCRSMGRSYLPEVERAVERVEEERNRPFMVISVRYNFGARWCRAAARLKCWAGNLHRHTKRAMLGGIVNAREARREEEGEGDGAGDSEVEQDGANDVPRVSLCLRPRAPL